MTSKEKIKKKEKSIDEYRRDIFSLKSKCKSEEQYLQELKEKYADLNVFGDQSYTYSMKMKILDYNLTDIKTKVDKYSSEPAGPYYELNFSTYAFLKACEIVGITPQMVFRGVDVDCKGIVNWFNFANFLKQTLRLDSRFINPIMKVLDPSDTTEVTQEKYSQFLESFMIETEKSEKQKPGVNAGVSRVCKELLRLQIKPQKIWKEKLLNIATCVQGLKSKQIDVLDCVAVYCKCDPTKQGMVETSKVVNMLEHKISDVKNFSQGDTFKIKKK